MLPLNSLKSLAVIFFPLSSGAILPLDLSTGNRTTNGAMTIKTPTPRNICLMNPGSASD